MTISFDKELQIDDSSIEFIERSISVKIEGPYQPYDVTFKVKTLTVNELVLLFDIKKRERIGLSSEKEEIFVIFPSATMFDKEFRVKYEMDRTLFWEQLE